MAKIKIVSNPYNREISYASFQEQSGEWESIETHNPNSCLREDESGKSFLPFKIKEIINIIKDEYFVGTDKVEIEFAGTNEEYREVEKVCAAKEIADKVTLTRTRVMLENARIILCDAKESFKTAKPIIEKIVKDDETVCSDLRKVSDALDDVIPICVFGNYSAGKSTFINALIGGEILPSGSDPVTAKTYEIKKAEHTDSAKIRFEYHEDPVELLFEDGYCRIVKGNLESDILVDWQQEIKDCEKADLAAIVYRALEFINGYEKKDSETIDISDVIRVEVPFSPNGILGQSQNKFVIFDTPGSNSNSNAEHSKVLEGALQGFSNGIPVWVTQYDSIDSEDNAALCDRILNIKALDKRFTMIVVNKADGAELPEDYFSQKQIDNIMSYESVRKIYASGIFFVSSIMGLGAKNNGRMTKKFYRKTYKDNHTAYSDKEDEDYVSLYRYNIMPEQIKAEVSVLSEEHKDLVYANSGLFCIEKEMEDFASKYSAYNKCQMVYSFLNTVVAETNRQIDANSMFLTELRNQRQQELDEQKAELISQLNSLASSEETNFHIASNVSMTSFIKKNLAYDCDVEELEKTDSRIFAEKAGEYDLKAKEQGEEEAAAALWNNAGESFKKIFTLENPKKDLANMWALFKKDRATAQEQRAVREEILKKIGILTSDEVMQIVIKQYQDSIMEAKERLGLATKKLWQDNAWELKERLVTVITGSKALLPAQRKQVAEIIMEYQPLEFDDNADEIFIKAKFLRANLFAFHLNAAERLSIRRLAGCYNKNMHKSISEMADDLNESCFTNFKAWEANLMAVLENNITDYNPDLRTKYSMIQEETEKLAELGNSKNIISKALADINERMTWKPVDFEEA